ncbi:MAG: hypothetical protein QM657_00535 [Lacrimispora sp.]|uniref:hypothetical protein n=1 Tax=Lacrimispora sp. TaxID=2719234 RepID=UPI0039E675D7
MNIQQQLHELSQKYSFENAQFKIDGQTPGLEVSLQLLEDHIELFLQKAGQINSIVESCANMVTIFDSSVSMEELMKTSLRCQGNDHLCIRTAPSMLKILVETLFD